MFGSALTTYLYTRGECELCFGHTNNSGFLCASCYQNLPTTAFACSQCAEPLLNSGRCSQCLAHPPAQDYALCNFLYQPPLNQWLLRLKDKHRTQYVAKLQWLLTHKQPHLTNIDAVTYIPSSIQALARRGFNPAEFLANAAAHQLKVPLLHKALIKHSSADQRSLNKTARGFNMQSALSPGKLDLTDQHILLIDDVITTGASMNAAAHALKQCGAKTVGIWALVRTPSPLCVNP